MVVIPNQLTNYIAVRLGNAVEAAFRVTTWQSLPHVSTSG
jgi:hypothetical protein